MKDQDKKEIVAKIKNKLQSPKTALQLILELQTGKRKRLPMEFIEGAIDEIDKAVRLLNKLAGW